MTASEFGQEVRQPVFTLSLEEQAAQIGLAAMNGASDAEANKAPQAVANNQTGYAYLIAFWDTLATIDSNKEGKI